MHAGPPVGMKVAAFEPEDLLLIDPQAAQLADIPRDQRLECGWQFKENGSAFTLWGAIEGEARPIFCGGHLRRHAGYASLWGLFSVHHARARLFLLRTVRRYVGGLSERRIDAQVASSNAGACEWARLVGLVEETRLRGAMPDGSDMIYFVKKAAS